MNQSKLRNDKDIWNDVAVPLDLPQSSASSSPAPRERTEGLREPVNVVPEVFWIAPEGLKQYVMEHASGSGSCLSVCNTHACLSVCVSRP